MTQLNPLMKRVIQLLFFSFFIVIANAQSGTISGVVRDVAGAGLSNASVTVSGTGKGTVTNNNGQFSIKVNPGTYTVTASFVGFSTSKQTVTVSAGQDATANFSLSNSGVTEEVVVLGSRAAARTRTETAVPVDVIPVSQVINEIGQVDLNQILNFIAPSFQSSRQTVSDGTDHVDPAQLRGLGTDQVLVLVNGKRRHQSALGKCKRYNKQGPGKYRP